LIHKFARSGFVLIMRHAFRQGGRIVICNFSIREDSGYCTRINPGDPIFMKFGSSWQHAVIVTDKSSSCYSPSNILVNSHTSYYKRTPLTAFNCQRQEL
jgi:hypothetical protein